MKRPNLWAALALPVSAVAVLSPFLFFGFSIAQGEFTADYMHPFRKINAVAVIDPTHSALLSEAYLPELKRALVHGSVPLLNMKSGLGALGVESFLTSSFYVLNPVLLLLPTDKPVYYTLFQILHICLLLFGLYVLLRLYSSPFVSAAVAIFVTFSGVTFLWMNLDTYRNASWCPWIIAGAVNVARNHASRKGAWMLCLALIASVSAGNPQETLVDAVATCIIFSAELYAAPKQGRFKAVILFCLSCSAAALVSAISVLPYLFSNGAGNIYTAKNIERSIQPYPWYELLTVLIPKFFGYYPFRFLKGSEYNPHVDLGPVYCFFIAAGMIACFSKASRLHYRHRFIVCATVVVTVALGYLKIVDFWPLRFVAQIPMVRNILFVRYYLYLYVLLSIVMAMGLEAIVKSDPGSRRRLVRNAAIPVVSAMVALVFYSLLSSNYAIGPEVEYLFRRAAYLTWIVSGFVSVTVATLCWYQPRCWRAMVIMCAVIQGLVLIPPGLGMRYGKYQAALAGDQPRFHHDRAIRRNKPDQSLFFGSESFLAYDGVLNMHYVEFVSTLFPASNGRGLMDLRYILGPTQVKALQLAGAVGIEGYPLENENDGLTEGVRPGPDHLIRDPLPRVFAVKQQTFDRLQQITLNASSLDQVLSLIRADLAVVPQPVDVHQDGTSFDLRLPGAKNSALVLNQAYSTFWTLNSAKADQLLTFLTAWPANETEDGELHIRYWPDGLWTGFILWIPAIVLMILMDKSARRVVLT